MRTLTYLVSAIVLSGCMTMAPTGGDLTPGMSQDRYQQYKNQHPGLGTKTLQALKSGFVFVGMDAEHIRPAIGAPTSINESAGADGTRFQYVYRVGPGQSSYVYVENGKVTYIQEGGADVRR